MAQIIIGWREFCSLPELGLGIIKAKIDTGATTSCLHAFNIKPCEVNGNNFIDFYIHPVQNRKDIIMLCRAPLLGRRVVSDSGGHKELRYVIKTRIQLGKFHKDAEVTLTDRTNMTFRMLIGREALKNNFVVDSGKSFLLEKLSKSQIINFYKS